MDDATRELIAELCMRAGALMENRSAELVSALPVDTAVIERRVFLIEQAGQDLLALAGAARVLHRLSQSGSCEG